MSAIQQAPLSLVFDIEPSLQPVSILVLCWEPELHRCPATHPCCYNHTHTCLLTPPLRLCADIWARPRHGEIFISNIQYVNQKKMNRWLFWHWHKQKCQTFAVIIGAVVRNTYTTYNTINHPSSHNTLFHRILYLPYIQHQRRKLLQRLKTMSEILQRRLCSVQIYIISLVKCRKIYNI